MINRHDEEKVSWKNIMIKEKLFAEEFDKIEIKTSFSPGKVYSNR